MKAIIEALCNAWSHGTKSAMLGREVTQRNIQNKRKSIIFTGAGELLYSGSPTT